MGGEAGAMRLTVGPLPAGVYWRRRALVLALPLLLVLIAVVRCGGSSGDGRASASNELSASSPTSAPPATLTPSTTSSSASASPSASSESATETTTEEALDGSVPVTAGTSAVTCADEDLTLTAGISPSPGVYGGTFTLSLTIVNVSGHDCSRDIGSGPQELRVQQGDDVIWSSDDCGGSQGTDVRTFGAGAGVRFRATWNSYRIAPDTCSESSEPAAEGTYQVVARLGTKLSEAVTFTIER